MIAALRLEWIGNGVKRSLRDVMFLVVLIRGLKPTATIISHYVTQATVASRQRILAVGFNPRKGFIHGLRRVATADDDLVGHVSHVTGGCSVSSPCPVKASISRACTSTQPGV